MNKKEYTEIVKRITPKEKLLENAINAFLMGGTLGFLAEGLKMLIVYFFHTPVIVAISWVLIIYIFLASLFTALGFMDNFVAKFKCGLIIPITGFSHSVTSACMDYKKDGFITGMGANIFKLAGCVLLYGVVAAFIMAIIKVIIYV